jgi:hypothetical protein
MKVSLSAKQWNTRLISRLQSSASMNSFLVAGILMPVCSKEMTGKDA